MAPGPNALYEAGLNLQVSLKQCYEILSTDYQLLRITKHLNKVAVKHTICQTYLQNKTHCPTCSHKKRTHEEFLLECRRKIY